MCDDHRWKRPCLLKRHPLFLCLRRLLRNVAGHGAIRFRHATEILSDQLQRLGGIEIANERERRVRRNVERVEEVADVIDRGGVEVLHAADRRVLVRMRRKRLVVDDLVQPAERLVVDPHPPLFLHHFAFGGEGVLVDPERSHPIGLEPQRQRQILRRHRFPEHRLVVVGVGVALAADEEMIEVCASGSTFFDPLNIMCSKRWAKPVRPGFSFFDPT